MSLLRRAARCLEFIVVGGGIAGLATALTLSRAGHRVRVLEAARAEPGLRPGGAGMKVPPNMAKILVQWGLGPALEAVCMRNEGTPFILYETGEKIGWMRWTEEVLKESGGGFYFVHHNDLYEMLFHAALEAGATILSDSAVVSVMADSDDLGSPSVILANGQVLKADLVVGADGVTSVVRDAVLGGHIEGQDGGMAVYSGNVSIRAMLADPDLRTYTENGQWPIFMGNGRSANIYPGRKGDNYTVLLWYPEDTTEVEERWDKLVSPAEYKFDMANDAPNLRKMWQLATSVSRSKIVNRPAAEEWVDESQRIVLVGDAAHPVMPCSIHAAALAIEDAAALGVLFGRLSEWDQVPTLLEAFQELRHERCAMVAAQELGNAVFVQFPHGTPHQQGRDAAMRASLEVRQEEWDANAMRDQWEEICEVFGYDASEAAEDWWIGWGSLREVSKARQGRDHMDWHMGAVTTVVAVE